MGYKATGNGFVKFKSEDHDYAKVLVKNYFEICDEQDDNGIITFLISCDGDYEEETIKEILYGSNPKEAVIDFESFDGAKWQIRYSENNGIQIAGGTTMYNDQKVYVVTSMGKILKVFRDERQAKDYAWRNIGIATESELII